MTTNVQSQPLIAVRSVRASSAWYRQLLSLDSLPEHPHRDLYERMYSNGQLILQLHAWDEEDHPNLTNPNAGPNGHGVLIWFQLDEFDKAVEQARALKAEIVIEPHVNPNSRNREIWLKDPDGHIVVIANRDGER
jgi:hypothetical protein